MGSCFFLLHFSLIIFLAAVSVSNCDDNPNYTACSILYSCGQLQNVGYPFWGDNRPKFCGIPDLKLSCKGKNRTNHPLYLPQNGYSPLNVLHINTSSHTIVVNQDWLYNKCHVKMPWESMNLTSSLQLDIPGYRQIQLLYGCTKCGSKYNYTCSNFDGTPNNTAHYFVPQSDISSISKSCSCKSNASFKVDKRVLDELNNNANVSLLSVLTKWPILMRYTAYYSACSKCEQSGGRCGSPEDQSSDRFVCYCRGGAHSATCPHEPGVGGSIFVLVAIVTIWCCVKKRHSNFVDHGAAFDCSALELEKGSRHYGVPLFSYRELVEATDNFDQSKEIGNGGFGTVYHGKLKDGREVAVKRLYEKSYKRIEQFMNEVHILTRLRHNNLVSLYGCTSQHCRELLLVYEYVQNGTVADHLFSPNTNSQSSLLPWPIRLRIAIETATALTYLHASDIIHRDVKTNNILLDSNFSVKVADFGLSRLFPTDVTHVSTAPQGTPGYLDPEYHQCYQLTDKSDVYSFGVVLIELVSSLPPIDMNRHRHEINLSNYAINKIQRCAFDELVDPQLGFVSDFKVRRMTRSVAELAFQCLQHDKGFRPSMEAILEALKRIEGADYDALLQAENMDTKTVEEVVKLRPTPSPTENDDVGLLHNHQLQPSSPFSVMENWVSRSTTPSTSK
ncbi:LEAF RUST 10 DISEASE-RESISTANCE LOCUS RECEPTOR-LIKE PROTEIN KINASE-like 1.1 [Bienertia sinuspersici]